MAEKVKLVLAQPDKVVKTGDFWGVVLPTPQDNLTIVADRAPSLILMSAGVLKLLDDEEKIVGKFFVSGGVAEVNDNVCTVSADRVLPKGSITLDEATRFLSASANRRDRAFYQAVCDELSAFPND